MALPTCRGTGNSTRIREILSLLEPLPATNFRKKESYNLGRELQKMTRSYEWTTETIDGATTTTSSRTSRAGEAAASRAGVAATTPT